MTDQLFQGQRILVTGANRGIGWATCEALAANGAHVMAGTRSGGDEFDAKLAALSDQYGVPVEHLSLDLTDADSIKQAISTLRKGDTPLYGLVSNAGLTYNALFQMTQLSVTRDIFEVNFFGLLALMQGCVRLMSRQKVGAIVNISSSAAMDANPGRSVYGASKAAVMTLTKASARELAPLGIRVNAIAPGMTDTEMLSSMTSEVIAEVEKNTDMQRRGQTSEIAAAACFLLSPFASYISGQTLRVDGGLRP